MKESEKDPNLMNNFLFVIKNTILIILLIAFVLFLGYNLFDYYNNNLIFIYETLYYYIIGIDIFLFLCWIVIKIVYDRTDEKYKKTRKHLTILSVIIIVPAMIIMLALPVGYFAYKDRYLTCHTYYDEDGFQKEKCIREEP